MVRARKKLEPTLEGLRLVVGIAVKTKRMSEPRRRQKARGLAGLADKMASPRFALSVLRNKPERVSPGSCVPVPQGKYQVTVMSGCLARE